MEVADEGVGCAAPGQRRIAEAANAHVSLTLDRPRVPECETRDG
jgi:hypothetical protein